VGGVFGWRDAGAVCGEEKSLTTDTDERLLAAEGAQEGRGDRRERLLAEIAEEAVKGAKKECTRREVLTRSDRRGARRRS
jgi:hypothetical protein